MGGARQAFHESGYDGASVDDIAARAGVSKATIYKHFFDKSDLFLSFIRQECEANRNRIFQVELRERDVKQALLNLAISYLDLILSDLALNTFRLVINETKRFPEIGQVFYESGIGKGSRHLAQFLAGAVARDVLDIDDIDLAAQQFMELCKADLFYKHLFGVKPDVSDAEKQRIAEKAVEVFWKAYAADQGGA